MVDLAIVAFIVLGAVAGFGKGFVVPLAAAGGAVLTLAALYAGPLTGALPSGTAGLGVGAIALFVGGTVFSAVATFVVGIVHRVGILRRFDKVLGVPLGMVTAAVTLYVAVLATLVLDGWLDPLHGKTAFGPQDRRWRSQPRPRSTGTGSARKAASTGSRPPRCSWTASPPTVRAWAGGVNCDTMVLSAQLANALMAVLSIPLAARSSST